MIDLFVYGTLRHLPLLETVLGRSADRIAHVSAGLDGAAAAAVVGEDFPILVDRTGARADGLLLIGLSDVDLKRLVHYEGAFSYGLSPCRVRRDDGAAAEAQVFRADPGRWTACGPWSLDAWVAAQGRVTTRAAAEIMAHFDGAGADRVTANRSGPLRRAWSWCGAQDRGADDGRRIDRDVELVSHTRPYVNFFEVQEVDLRHRRHDGRMGPLINRAAINVGEAAVVLPYDPRRDCVLVVEQFRAAVYLAGDRAPWVWEAPAGLIDAGEAAEDAARREALEEAHVRITRLEAVGRAYSSTGSSTEFLHLYVGLADLTGASAVRAGLAEEGEDIHGRVQSFDDLMAEVDAGACRDLPLLTCALWLARHRDRLRRG